MFCNFNMDIIKDFSSFIRTPAMLSQTLPFFILGCGHFYAGKDYYTEREEFDNYLLIYTRSGSGSLSYKGSTYLLKPHCLALISCYDKHLYKTGSEGSWEIQWILFQGRSCSSYNYLINRNSLHIIKVCSDSDEMIYISRLFKEAVNDDINADLRISMYINNLLTWMATDSAQTAIANKSGKYAAFIDNVKKYVNENYHNRISVSDMINDIHLSRFHFSRLFKRHTGSSPYEYLMKYRINMAKILLLDTDKTVKEISYETGFNNQNNFIREFKKIVGITPLEFKKYRIK